MIWITVRALKYQMDIIKLFNCLLMLYQVVIVIRMDFDEETEVLINTINTMQGKSYF